MSTITPSDGTRIFYKDWGSGQPVVFSHGWPLSGDDDQIVPIAASALRSAKIAPQAMLKVYAGAPHGLPMTLQDRLNADLLAFVASERLQEQHA